MFPRKWGRKISATDEKPSTYYTLNDAKFLSNLQRNVKLCEHDNNRSAGASRRSALFNIRAKIELLKQSMGYV